MEISPAETEIAGRWVWSGGGIAADAAAERIRALIESHLRMLGRSGDGWSTLYEDPTDGRLWELTYPESHLHGGGPPNLSLVTRAAAEASYTF